MTTPLRKFVIFVLLALIVATLAGCTDEPPANIDWATPAAEVAPGIDGEIQAVLDTYTDALVAKDRQAFLSVIDSQATDFHAQQALMFDRLTAVPFDRFQLDLESYSDAGQEQYVIKVTNSSTLKGSFAELPEPGRTAFFMNRKDGSWKLSGDANYYALGKDRDARLEDFDAVTVLEGEHVIVLYHDSQHDVALQAREHADTAYRQLVGALPEIELPRVPLYIFDNKQQIDLAFPGQWQQWVGGASRPLGDSEQQGGEVILDAGIYRSMEAGNPAYNGDMIAHEYTHVALFALSGKRTPPFMVEGLADYVGGIEPAGLVKTRLESGDTYSPTLDDLCQPASFAALLTPEAAQLAYEQSSTAVNYLIETHGSDNLIQLFHEFRQREVDDLEQGELVNEVFQSVLDISWDEFESGWRRYLLGN